jgi:hypothetical protein
MVLIDNNKKEKPFALVKPSIVYSPHSVVTTPERQWNQNSFVDSIFLVKSIFFVVVVDKKYNILGYDHGGVREV